MSLRMEDLSVLLIEPSSTQAKIIQQVLSNEGIVNQDHHISAQTALQYIKQYAPDLVISAMYFDDMTAIELLQEIRKDSALDHVNFMLISSETKFARLDPIKQAGVLAILPKPFDQRDFHNALSAARDSLEVQDIELENFDVDDLVGLIVDDSPLSRKHIEKMINGCGINNCLFAENGREAVEQLLDNKIDFIITDYNMPEMDGKELVEYVQQSEFAYIPIIMISSESNSARLSALRQAGVCALFDKAVDPTSFRNTLSHSLNA
ncbi:response regulator [Bermanella sp. R86510]|uniref:response regulator transcription factor n=1 Tax=unclassified Bermanella TaxID=2627862 RepID=UPI0037C6C7EF